MGKAAAEHTQGKQSEAFVYNPSDDEVAVDASSPLAGCSAAPAVKVGMEMLECPKCRI